MTDQIQAPKGFRDFLPIEKRKRDYVATQIKQTFEKYGFAPLETPTLEYASLLLGKYGEDADKLVYSFEDQGGRQVALRYDQTVPTARILAQYRNDIPKYFRRYQIQNVFRAEKPQKGRYREFTQCDADIFGSTSPVADAEIIAVYYSIYRDLGFKSLVIEYNDRKTLTSTLSKFATPKVTTYSLTQSVDKLDKLSPEEVIDELVRKGLDYNSAKQSLSAIKVATPSPDLTAIIKTAISLGVPETSLRFNPALARGLDYYTGLIFEGKILEYGAGSVGGGGRYNNLINQLSGYDVPAVGFGLGFDRTVEAADELGLIPDAYRSNTDILITLFDESTVTKSLELASKLRTRYRVEVYPTIDKLDRQLKYADKNNVPYVAIIGPDEIAKDVVLIKNLTDGTQKEYSLKKITELSL